jgi:hypothetical protein
MQARHAVFGEVGLDDDEILGRHHDGDHVPQLCGDQCRRASDALTGQDGARQREMDVAEPAGVRRRPLPSGRCGGHGHGGLGRIGSILA